jgi:nitrogen-specific signal transduction histidine kinase/CheY-like chemotaxis protein
MKEIIASKDKWLPLIMSELIVLLILLILFSVTFVKHEHISHNYIEIVNSHYEAIKESANLPDNNINPNILRADSTISEIQLKELKATNLLSILFALIIVFILLFIYTLYRYQLLITSKLRQSLGEKTDEIVERKNAEKSLSTARDYITSIIDSMPSIIIGVNEGCVVTQWNKAAEEWTKVLAKDALNHELVEVFPDLKDKIEEVRKSIRTQTVKQTLNSEVKSDLGIRFENRTIYPLITNETCGAVIRIDDVSKEHGLEKQLSHKRRMDSIGQLAGGVAHDFNNMLAGIMGAAQLLESPKQNLNKDALEFVDLIMKATMRAADLTSKLLAFGRKGDIASTEIDISSIIENSVAILARTLDKKIVIESNTTAEISNVVGDNSTIQNSIMNMCINASQAMPDGGNLNIITKNRVLSESYCLNSSFNLEPGNYLDIEINDNGIGIPVDNISKVFEPFFTTQEEGDGTGLGLSAVYGTIQDHSGAISVESEVGVGTTFHILLPCTEETVNETYRKSVVKGTGKILLVDDEEIIRITARLMLKDMGYEVDLAVNGLKAVEKFKDNSSEYDLVIMDMIMPKMNGREAFFEMKKIDPDCKIIISSGFTKDENLKELRTAGLNGFLKKPYVDFELSKMVAESIS